MDRRLLFAGGALALVVVVVLGVVAFTRGGSTTPQPVPADAAGAAASTAGKAGTRPAGSPLSVLRSLLNPTVMTGCTAPARSDSAYADATLNCKDSTGVRVTAFHFPNQSAVDRQIGARETYYADEGNCDDGQQSWGRWKTSAEPSGGARLCYFFAQRFYEFWTYDRDLVAFSVDDPDPSRLNSWWHAFDPIRH